MQNKNVDGLNKPGVNKIQAPVVRVHVKVDSVIRRPKIAHQKIRLASYNKSVYSAANFQARIFTSFDFVKKFYTQKRVPVAVAVIALFLAFGGGVVATLNTSKTQAEQPQVLGASTNTPSLVVQPSSPLGQIGSLPDNVMFNMTLSHLEDYLNKVAENNQQEQRAQILAQREKLLKQYLQEKGSPLAAIADTIAGLKHWQLVLAISNSESSLGRHCPNENCTGIGILPGNPLWHTYASKAEWAKDMDKLIEKRYEGWTLEQMNGTYNKPGSANWIEAAKQILEDLQQRGIE